MDKSTFWCLDFNMSNAESSCCVELLFGYGEKFEARDNEFG